MGTKRIKTPPTAPSELRRRAEDAIAKAESPAAQCDRKLDDTLRLVHELEVHQIELEMQNAELRRSRDEFETLLDKYADLYDFAPIGYVTLDDKGAICAANLTGARHLGIDRSRMVGKRFGQFIADDDRAPFSEFLDKVFMTKNRELCEMKLIRENDPPLFVRIEAVALESKQECRLAFIDITRRKQAEEKLLRLNRLYSMVGEIDQAIIRAQNYNSIFQDFCRITVEQGGFLLAWVGLLDMKNGELHSVASCGAVGYLNDILLSAEEVLHGTGPTCTAIREGTYCICNDFQNDHSTRPWHERGRSYGIQSSASVAVKEDGWVVGALTLYSVEKDFFDQQHVEMLGQLGADISFALDNLMRETRRQKAEKALQEETLERLLAVEDLRKKEQLLLQQSRLAAMGEMINNIAHQWRQPLNILGLMVQQMQLFYETDSFTREFVEDNAKKSMKLINHMSQTIDDFRHFFKLDREKMEFSISEAVARTISLVEDGFKDNRIKINFHVEATPKVVGFVNEFCHVVLNILMNAKDVLLERCTDNAAVTISIDTEDKWTVVTIADNAGGMAADVIDKMFEPYFTTKGPAQGTGVGLFMAKTIVEKNMNGRLTARNTDVGAEFRIMV